MSRIARLEARRLWDSRGNPTVEVEVTTESGSKGRAIAPAGASRGSREAVDLRDGGERLGGLDVSRALGGLRGPIAAAIIGLEVADQEAADAALIALDGTPDKSRLGGNATVAASLAILHAAAAEAGRALWQHVSQVYGRTPSLPLPEIQIFGGGAHAGRRVDVQDFMLVVPGARDLDEVMEVTAEVYRAAGSILRRRGRSVGVADEGGWWPTFDSNEEALGTLLEAISLAGETPGARVAIALDIAASEFGKAGRYRLTLEDRELDSAGMIAMLQGWLRDYPIRSIEDPLAEDDTEGMAAFTATCGDRVQIVGDDYLVTQAEVVMQAAGQGACNAVLIKVNQVGTVSEAVACLRAAEVAGYRAIVSARSGETEDVSISHLAVGLGVGQIKVGSFARSERMAKWNELLRIAEDPLAGVFVGGLPYAATGGAHP